MMSFRAAKDYQERTGRVMADQRYQENIEFEYEWSQPGHPEGKVKHHIADLEANLERLKHLLPDEEFYWKLKFLIHVHDTFKAHEIREHVPANHPESHESLARAFASEFTDNVDMLNIVQYHDENYTLWKQFKKNGRYNRIWFQYLLDTIQDWDLFLAFTLIDGHTQGKEIEKLSWFIQEVSRYKKISVNESWLSCFKNPA
jgi:hypothetical protein